MTAENSGSKEPVVMVLHVLLVYDKMDLFDSLSTVIFKKI